MTREHSRFLSLSDRTVHVLELGTGEPLLLLHGTAIDSAWLSYGQHLDHFARHFHIFAPDFPGYGQSVDPQKRYRTAEQAEFLVELLDHLQLEQVSVVAFSMGGAIALQVALDHPQRFKKLVLVDSFGLFGNIHVPWVPKAGVGSEKFARWLWELSRKHPLMLATVLKMLVIRNGKLVTPQLVQELQQEMTNFDTFLQWLRSELGWTRYTTNFAGRLSSLQVPTLLVHAAQDRVTPASRSVFASQKIPHARHVVVPASGHWVMREQPEVWRKVVLEFLLEQK